MSRYSRGIVATMPDSAMMQIGEVADRVGLSLRTVRYYEEMGLVEPETRTEGGFRLYTEAHVDRLELVKRMKPLGFTVQEMRDLLDARDAQDRERLAEFAREAANRCEVLRAKLDSGEELARQLRRESRRSAKTAAKH
ncbi:MAG: MerR family transcriptional regulator [Solirubrobacteraceae bacterium]